MTTKPLKSSFSKKAAKIWKNLPLVLTLLSKNSCFVKLCGLLTMYFRRLHTYVLFLSNIYKAKKLVWNCNFLFKYNFFTKLFSEWKPCIAKIIYKSWKIVVQKSRTPLRAAPEQLSIPLDKLPYFHSIDLRIWVL